MGGWEWLEGDGDEHTRYGRVRFVIDGKIGLMGLVGLLSAYVQYFIITSEVTKSTPPLVWRSMVDGWSVGVDSVVSDPDHDLDDTTRRMGID